MEKRSFNLSAILGVAGAVLGARHGWRGMEYKNILQRIGNVGKGAKKGFFDGLDTIERVVGPYASRFVAGQARRISSDPSNSNFVRGIARKIGAGRALAANKYQSYINPSNPGTAVDYGKKSAYQLFQSFVPGGDFVGAMLHRTDPSERRLVSSIFDTPKPDYTGQLNRMGARLSNAANKYIQGINTF